jgi:hypothetical protein
MMTNVGSFWCLWRVSSVSSVSSSHASYWPGVFGSAISDSIQYIELAFPRCHWPIDFQKWKANTAVSRLLLALHYSVGFGTNKYYGTYGTLLCLH